ncbi:MAG: amidohydrolase [Ferruginibacter sp.]|nr:amidohydrolase [Cytophagales bacterium]
MLTLTLIQSSLHWENVPANLAMWEEKIWRIDQSTDLIILPEMFNTGFTTNAAVAEPMNLHTFKWMKQQAQQTGAVVTGSYLVREREKYYNRLVWMRPDGSYETYDKRHLFRLAGEHLTFSAGTRRLVTEWKGWRICPLVCYDLRFPVWSRNAPTDYDLLIYVANWPGARRHAWKTLLPARAIENLAYVAGVNRVGSDGKNLGYSGDSAVYDYQGEVLSDGAGTETLLTLTLDQEALVAFRSSFPAHLDADAFEWPTP